jgi:hypothetical protein
MLIRTGGLLPGAWQSYCGPRLRTSTEFDLKTPYSREKLLWIKT